MTEHKDSLDIIKEAFDGIDIKKSWTSMHDFAKALNTINARLCYAFGIKRHTSDETHSNSHVDKIPHELLMQYDKIHEFISTCFILEKLIAVLYTMRARIAAMEEKVAIRTMSDDYSPELIESSQDQLDTMEELRRYMENMYHRRLNYFTEFVKEVILEESEGI